MTDHSALIRAFADYAETISRRYDIGEVLYRLTDQVVEVLPVDGAGVSLGDQGGVLRFVTATDENVVHVEEQQVTAGEGPCQDAYTTGTRIAVADLTAEQRWPRFRPVALAQGFGAVAGIPMAVQDQRIGALNLYRRRSHDWPADELDIAQLLASMATGYIVNARTLAATEQLAEQLQHALDSRIVIEQAKGILAERHRIDPGAAFDLLRKHARSVRVKLHDVARDVVDGTAQL